MDGLEPASSIIKKLGVADVAKATNRAITAPYRWQAPKSKGGTDGRIPSGHIPALLALAEKKRVELTHADFFKTPAKEDA